ncbi:hypothetical protein LUZ60_002654 [Juncus effusus]|nr:hypothetical protein LUZ60_002654 [Juncus effusus]
MVSTASQTHLCLTSSSHKSLATRYSSKSFFDLNSQKCCVYCFQCKKLLKTNRKILTGVHKALNSSSEVEQMRIKLDKNLENEDLSTGFVQSIYDAARAIELAFLERSSAPKGSWFSRTWLGSDRYAWIKLLSYQAAVDSLLQAAIEVSSRGDLRDRDINVFVQRSLSRLRGPLETEIRDQISRKKLEINEWYWSNQNPLVVTTFVNLFEKDIRFSAATSICAKTESTSKNSSEVSLLMLSLSCLASIPKLGSAKISCQNFFSNIPDAIYRLMDKLLDFVPVSEAYQSLKDIGLEREFLVHCGPRAAMVKEKITEMPFWVDLLQRKLQRAIAREKIWSRLTTCESIEVLEKDLTIFGFFIALGRSTQAYLSSNGFKTTDDPLDGIIRYLIGGSVLYYPQLSSVSSYQLYVEVVCEELEWLPFYGSVISKADSHDSSDKITPPKEVKIRVLAVCYYWMNNFRKHSSWLQNPSNVKAASFLSKGEAMLSDSMKELGVTKDLLSSSLDRQIQIEPKGNLSLKLNLDSIDEALESVDTALVKLENLLEELHISSSNPGNKEQLQAACSDLERIRKLKKQAEFLEASFRAKASSFQEVDGGDLSSSSEQVRKAADSESRNFWSFLVTSSTKKAESEEPATDQNNMSAKEGNQDPEATDISRIEKLTNELIELEKRVQKSANSSRNIEDGDLIINDNDDEVYLTTEKMTTPSTKKEDLFTKSMEKLKDTTTDVWQGTQLLAIDLGAAMVLLRRSVLGDELTEKEKKALQRTLTDLASVIPIGILMLLPVTAVGHAAILAFIQRYVPALIPSTYAPERLDLLRQLEKVKKMEISSDMNTEKESEAMQ